MTREGLVKKITQISIPGKEGCCIFKSFTPPPLGKNFFRADPALFCGMSFCHIWFSSPHFRQGNWLETLLVYRKIKASIIVHTTIFCRHITYYCKTHLLPFLLRVAAIYSHRQILFCCSSPLAFLPCLETLNV